VALCGACSRERRSFLLLAALLVASGCGSSSKSTTASPAASAGGTSAPESSAALAADAKSAATGDIPDSQNFLTLHRPTPAHLDDLPRGMERAGSRFGRVDQGQEQPSANSPCRRAAAPTTASVQAQVAALKRSSPALTAGSVQNDLADQRSRREGDLYDPEAAPNPVTGKQVTLMVDRYELSHGGRVAVVELGTPTGVDNIDAYKRMIQSFKWQ